MIRWPDPPMTRSPSSRPEDAVAGVAEAGTDEGVLVELAVEGSGDDGDVRVEGLQAADALGRGDEADEREVARAAALEVAQRRRRAPARGQHGVHGEHARGAEARRH